MPLRELKKLGAYSFNLVRCDVIGRCNKIAQCTQALHREVAWRCHSANIIFKRLHCALGSRFGRCIGLTMGHHQV
jgi:hypothetical protein